MAPNGFGPAGTVFTDNCNGFGMNARIGTGFQGSYQPGFGGGMGFQGNFPPGYGMPFPGYFGPGMGYQGGFNTMPGMWPVFQGPVQPGFAPGVGPYFEEDYTTPQMMSPTPYMPGPMPMGWGLGGGRRWGGTYSPQFMTTGIPTDDEVVEMVYDSIDNDPLIPYDAAINVESDAGTVTLTGTVTTKQIKHAAGDDAWWIPGVDDVCNDLSVERRHPARAAREQRAENQPPDATPPPREPRRGATRR